MTYTSFPFLRDHCEVTKENTSRNEISHRHPPNSGMKQVQGCERIDRGAIDYFSQVDVFVWSVRHGQQAGSVSIGRDALSGVEAGLQQAGTHLKTRRFARNRSYATRQRYPEPRFLTACGRLALLQYLPFEWNAFAPATLEDRDQSALLVEVFLGIDAPIDGEPALLWHHVEVRAASALPAQHQNRLASLIRP